MKNFKTTKAYLILSGLFLANALLLYGVTWTVKDTYFIDITLITLLMSWIGLFCIVTAIGSFIKELYKFLTTYVKTLNNYKT